MSELSTERMDMAIEYLRDRKNRLLEEIHNIDECIRAIEANKKR